MSQPTTPRQFTDAEKQMISAMAGNGLHQHHYQFTIGMFDEEHKELSSGTLVRIEGRIFVATAAHNIPSRPWETLQILPDQPRPTHLGILRPGMTGIDRTHDVGFVEIDPAAFAEYFPGKQCCSLGQISIMGIGDSAQLMVLVGTPVQFAEVNRTNKGPPFVAKQITFTSTVLNQTEWPSSFKGGRAIDPAVDVFLKYPTTGTKKLDTGEPLVLTTPHGFSGGGMWSSQMKKGEVWSPSMSQLFAIENSWDDVQRIVRGTQIIHWLNLLRSKNPELREHLQNAFPELTDYRLLD
jgi:hypothetical protein